MSSLPTGWNPPKAKGRIYTHRGPRPIDPPPGSWGPQDLHVHVRGRADATAQLLLDVAVLKQRGSIWNYVVGYTGAVWQDWEGSSWESERAHRAPCNPTIGNRNIPDLAEIDAFRDALIAPLDRTDFLPKAANYCDGRFESLGGAKSLTDAVLVVAREQERNKPLNYDLFRHALVEIALPGYKTACAAVCADLLNQVNREDAIELRDRIDRFNPRAPKDNIEAAQDAAQDLLRFTMSSTSNLLHPVAFKTEVERLNDLATGK
jgi:hypothetical protein